MWEIFVHFLISVSKVKEIDSRECIPESIQIRRETQKSLRHTTMFTYSHANTPLGQSERAYYLSYFINSYVGLCRAMQSQYGYVKLFMAMQGCVRLFRVVYGYVGLCRAMYGYVWLCRVMQGYVRLCRARQVYVLLYIDLQGYILTNVKPLYDAYTTYLLGKVVPSPNATSSVIKFKM